MDNRGIGVFDSGFGGLTVVKELNKIMPSEKIYYFGDTARVPYGSKSSEKIVEYSLEIANFLLEKNIKLLIIACNTATAYALDKLRAQVDIPVLGVIEAGSKRGIKKSKRKKIGVVATERTIKSGSYIRGIKRLCSKVEIYQRACPMFVPMIEEGMTDGEMVELAVRKYLEDMVDSIDTLILGCTHYPLIEREIRRYTKNIEIVNPAIELAKDVEELLVKTDSLSKAWEIRDEFYVSDCPQKFKELGEKFLGREMKKVEEVDLITYRKKER